MNPAIPWHRRLFQAVGWVLCSPLGWVVLGGIVIALWLTTHALGWRSYTSAFSGTPPAAGARGDVLILLGLLYAALYFVTVLVAPFFIGAGLLRLALRRVFGQG